jgi:hypothetical protein
VAAVTCTEVEKVASIPSEIADVDGFSFLGIEAVATEGKVLLSVQAPR